MTYLARVFSVRYRKHLWLFLVVMCLMGGTGISLVSPSPEKTGLAQDNGDVLVSLNESNIKQATVFVMQAFDEGSGPVITCVGSGTLVSADGLILTNYHVVEESDFCPADRIIIALTLRLDEPPVPTYLAEIVEESLGLDLAVLRITSYLDGRVIDRADLNLPFVELGDSDAIRLDDTISVFGYPEIRNDPVTVVRGTVSGFTAEARAGERAWIRTLADIPGFMTGGGAYNRAGELIGIPTITPARAGGEAIDCRRIYDSNYDRQIDAEDRCIAVGGSISALRPSRLARGLVRAAALGIRLGPESSPLIEAPPTDPPQIDRVFVTTGVNSEGMPINVVSSAPTGTNSLYVFFDYDHMQDGLVYELRTTIDGRPNLNFSLPPVTWSGGRRGMWYIGNTVPSRQNGEYEFTLFVEGRQLASHRVTIGGGPRPTPQFSDIIFGIQNAQGELVGANYVIPEGNVIRARFNYRNMQPGLQWQQRWYLDQTLLNPDAPVGVWEGSAEGTSSDAGIESAETGFPSGRYRLELWLQPEPEGDLVLSATADFVIAGGAGGANDAEALVFSEFLFARGENANLPVGVSTEDFPTELPSLFVFFNWRQLSPGTPYVWRWLVDDEVLIERYTIWSAPPGGENYYLSLVGTPALPDATYTFEIEMGGIRLDSVQAKIGLGQLPLETFASADGIQLTGRIVDAETELGIAGAMFIVLLPEFSIEDFEWRDSQILGRAVTDQDGFFQIPALLPRGTLDEPLLYSVLVRAEGYFPIDADGIIVVDQASPLEFSIEMNRD